MTLPRANQTQRHASPGSLPRVDLLASTISLESCPTTVSRKPSRRLTQALPVTYRYREVVSRWEHCFEATIVTRTHSVSRLAGTRQSCMPSAPEPTTSRRRCRQVAVSKISRSFADSISTHAPRTGKHKTRSYIDIEVSRSRFSAPLQGPRHTHRRSLLSERR